MFERASLVFVFNFHPHKSFTDYKIGVEIAGKYPFVFRVVLMCEAHSSLEIAFMQLVEMDHFFF